MRTDLPIMEERKIICGPEDYDDPEGSLAASLGLKYPDLHYAAESLACFSLALARRRKSIFCALPFCGTVEAEALGALINMGDAATGPRPGKCLYNDFSALWDGLGRIDFSKGRIAEVIKACALVKGQGGSVIVEISGPLSILNCLIEFSAVIKTWRKNETLIAELFARLAGELTEYMMLLRDAGVSVLSFSDPMAAVGIIGPRYAASFSELFLLPLMRDLRPKLGNMVFHLCPRTAYSLLDLGFAEWQPLNFGRPLTYGEAIEASLGKEAFMGKLCINRLAHRLEDGRTFALRLVSARLRQAG